jgi:uncharacterized protein (DUF2235 family)
LVVHASTFLFIPFQRYLSPAISLFGFDSGAARVYHFFIKAVGILLFMVEMVWFVAKPFWSEFVEWKKAMASDPPQPAAARHGDAGLVGVRHLCAALACASAWKRPVDAA